jgi:multiple sugar transport system permease protein
MSAETPPILAHVPAVRAAPVPGRRRRQELAWGLAFLAPNILGFLAFTAIPLVFSLVLAFTNWDLKLHNPYARLRDPEVSIQFRGLQNFVELFQQANFWRYLGNTLFYMMGIPIGIAAALLAAIMLSRDLRGGRVHWLMLASGAVLTACVLLLAAWGAGASAMVVLMVGLLGGILVLGTVGGNTIYRTLFYIPNFTSGVATMILWKKLYNPDAGPINQALTPPLDLLASGVEASPAWVIQAGTSVCLLLLIALLWLGLRRLRLYWADGDVGWGSALASALFLVLPLALGAHWLASYPAVWIVMVLAGAGVIFRNAILAMRTDRAFTSPPGSGLGTALMLSIGLMVGQFVLIGLAVVCLYLREWSADGLIAPRWLADIAWAKPAIMLMGFWGAIGSQWMLLYLAALGNVPVELYEAADMDGATRFQRFWNITWPQLAPTTFFIVVMATIGGLQQGFETARVMPPTPGGPAGSTTTLAYFIYNEGFVTGRLGFSSAVAWTLFLMVLLITLFNWKFGNKYVND